LTVAPLTNAPAADAAFSANTPLRRWDEPTEIGGIVLLLAPAAAVFITGSALIIDSGRGRGRRGRVGR